MTPLLVSIMAFVGAVARKYVNGLVGISESVAALVTSNTLSRHDHQLIWEVRINEHWWQI